MYDLDELLIQVSKNLSESSTITKTNYGKNSQKIADLMEVTLAKHFKNKNPIPMLRPDIVPGMKHTKTDSGGWKETKQDGLEKLHRVLGAQKARRTNKAKGITAQKRKVARQKKTMKVRQNVMGSLA